MLVPPRLRGYTVERLLSRGGSSDVWQARVGSGTERVALKRIVVGSAEQVQKAHDEAALLAALDHENLVRLHTVLPVDDALVLVLDLAEGGSLADLLAARHHLSPGEVITALAPVAAAVAYLHDAGVVHGDVSPANILFNARGAPLLSDVGVARLTGDDADAAATPAYVDPAVAAGCVPGPQSDVFMLGGVALHALTGTPPWPAPDADRALAQAAAAEPLDAVERLAAAQVPDAMAGVVCRALSTDPQRRGTAADFALDLRHSGRPLAVDLLAGRLAAARPPLRAGPRHAAVRPGSAARAGRAVRPADGVPPADAGRPDADAGRPEFDRPTAAQFDSSASDAPPTRMIAARPRPVIPRPVQRRRVRWPLIALAGVLTALAVAVVLAQSGSGFPEHGAMSTPRADVETASGKPGAPVPGRDVLPPPARTTNSTNPKTTTNPTTTPPRRGSRPADDWARLLDALDAVRARAFASRNATLLGQVYVPGPLLREDVALLGRVVPAGCGLTGVRTRYDDVAVARSSGRARITARAALQPSRLICGGRLRARAPGRGPLTLRVVLVRTPEGVRIADQRAG